VLNESSTGSEDDLEEATALARDIVGRYGMSDVLGPARLLASDADLYLAEDSRIGSVSETTHQAIDREVRELLTRAETDARAILAANRRSLDSLAARLLDVETVEGDELHRYLAKVSPPADKTATNGPARRRSTRQSAT
jgi:cell division protease FtsH